MFVEEFEGARPRQFGGRLVITRRRVVVEAVLFALVHVERVRLLVGLKRRLVGRDALVDPLVIARVLQQQRRGDFGDVVGLCSNGHTKLRSFEFIRFICV